MLSLLLKSGKLSMPEQNRLAWRLAGLLHTKVDRIFDWKLIWAAKAFIPDPSAIERLMVERGQYDDQADPCEALYDAIGRVYGEEAYKIVRKLVCCNIGETAEPAEEQMELPL